jgi:hypothetical protein
MKILLFPIPPPFVEKLEKDGIISNDVINFWESKKNKINKNL